MNKKMLALAIVCSSGLLAPHTLPAQDSEETLEEVVVTGSRIARRDLVSPSPIATLEAKDLQLSAQPTIEETLSQMPQFSPNFGRASNNPGNGSALLDLRGMGAGRTLIMLNGRRLAPSSQGNSVDINNIPQALIERVEIITGGASTVYGSDALAGVVNFITKKDFQGFSIDASYGVSEQGDANYGDLNLAFGTDFASGKGHMTVFGGMFDREAVFAGSRDATTLVLQEDLSNGTLYEGGSYATPSSAVFFPEVDFGNGPWFATFDPDGSVREFIDPDDTYNYQPVNYLQLPMQRYSLGATANYTFASETEVYFETMFVHNEVAQELAPVPLFDFFVVNLDNPVLIPETQQFFADNYFLAPNLAGLFTSRRVVETGPRHVDNERNYWRSVLGFRHDFSNGWAIDGWVTYTSAEEEEILLNDVSRSRIHQGLLVDPVSGQCYDPSGGCVAVDIFGAGRISEAAANFVRIDPMINTTERVQKLATVFVTGSPFDSWAGPVDLAIGAQWRSDDVEFKADNYLFTGDALGFNGDAPVSGVESVAEAYFEALIPLLGGATSDQSIELEIGARYSDYENAEGIWTYKAGGNWQINSGLRFRTMYQKSVRAPNNLELFQEQYTEVSSMVFDPTDDPCSASQDPVGNGFTDACVIQGLDESDLGVFEASFFLPVDFILGGNPNLISEEAQTFTAGFVISPGAIPNWTFTVDYYDIEITDEIGGVDAFGVCFDTSNTGNVFCDSVYRDATGNMVQIDDFNQNRGIVQTSGIDTQVRYASELPDSWSLFDGGADFSVDLNWTHMLDVQNQENVAATIVECTGYFNSPCAGVNGTAMENRALTNFRYMSGPLAIALSWRWIQGTRNFEEVQHLFYGGPPNVVAVERAADKSYFNLNFSYRFGDDISARFGITNLTGTDAPLIPNNNNTDYLLYDVFGRSYSLTLSMVFGN